MKESSMPNRAMLRAQHNIKGGLERARKRMANVPLGMKKQDPRTTKNNSLSSGEDAMLHRIAMTQSTSSQFIPNSVEGDGMGSGQTD